MTDQHVKESLLAYIILLTSATGPPPPPPPPRRIAAHSMHALHGFATGCDDSQSTDAAGPAFLKETQQ